VTPVDFSSGGADFERRNGQFTHKLRSLQSNPLRISAQIHAGRKIFR
jgi:hypothetical protein